MNTQPMDIDPIDGGPREIIKPSHPPSPSGNMNYKKMEIAEEEEARQAIDMFRGDDVSARVAAANRLEAVATVLGEQRTREVGGILYLFSWGIHLMCFYLLFIMLRKYFYLVERRIDFRGCVVSCQKKSLHDASFKYVLSYRIISHFLCLSCFMFFGTNNNF